jgi:glycine/D-amino acid oxidase-like deaminating enzyme
MEPALIVAFTVRSPTTGETLGSISVMNIRPEHGTAELGNIWYAPSAQRTGANTEACWLLLRHAFEDLGYRRMEWKCNALNEASRRAAPTVSLLDDATKLVTSRLGDNRFRVAGTAEFNGHDMDIRADRIRPLIRWVEQCFPGVSTKSVVPWAGLRPMMPSMLPRVGRGRLPTVFYNTGHGHLGWTLSAVTAEMVAGTIDQSFGTVALPPSVLQEAQA